MLTSPRHQACDPRPVGSSRALRRSEKTSRGTGALLAGEAESAAQHHLKHRTLTHLTDLPHPTFATDLASKSEEPPLTVSCLPTHRNPRQDAA